MTPRSLWQRLDHVQLAIPPGTEDQCRSFYKDLLGFAEVTKPPALSGRGGVWFESGDLRIHCGVEEDFSPAKKAHPGMVTYAIDEVASLLSAAGHDVLWDDELPGYRRFYTPDPFGNRLEIMEPL